MERLLKALAAKDAALQSMLFNSTGFCSGKVCASVRKARQISFIKSNSFRNRSQGEERGSTGGYNSLVELSNKLAKSFAWEI